MKILKNSIIIGISAILVLANVSTSVYGVEENKTQESIEIPHERKIVEKIDFERVLQKAKEHSYDLQIADYNVLIAKQGIRYARSEYFPKLNFNAGTEYTKNFRDVNETTVMSIGDAFINPYTRFQSVLGVTVGYNLFDFGVRGGNLKIAKKDVKLKNLELKEKTQDMNMALLDIYTKLLITSKQVELNNKILEIEQQNLDYNKRLFDAKEISKNEFNSAKIKVSETKDKINELLSLEQESLNWLSFYTGEDYDINTTKIQDLKLTDFDVLEFQDYTKSIVWQKHEETIKKKELELYVVKRTNYPKLNVYGRYYLYGSDKNNYGKSLGHIEPSNLSVGASLNMPLFDGLKNRSNIEKTKLELKQLYVERDKAIAELMTKLANMRSNLIYLDNRINGNNAVIKELEDNENSSKRLVSKKIISPIEYNNAKIELINGQIELIKNSITKNAITKGIEILTEEI